MFEVASMEGDFGTRHVLWAFITFAVPLAIVLVTFYMGSAAFFWGLLGALSLLGVLLPLSLVDTA